MLKPMFGLLMAAVISPALAHQSMPGSIEASGFADRHAPIGVMGDHRHDAGGWMFSYRHADMGMNGLKDGSDGIGRDDVAAMPGVRVVPTQMKMEMHMPGLMYAPSDRLTFMVMGSYVKKEMDLVTYDGMAGTEQLGEFSTESKGWGDTTLSALIGLNSSPRHKLHLNIGLSLPTGEIENRDTVLTPRGATARIRLPYGMQLGSGTYDLQPGVTYNGYRGKLSWGSQYRATLRMGENSEDYTLGDRHEVTAWASVRQSPWLSTSLRLAYAHAGDIRGQDQQIAAPVSTANPENYGGQQVHLYFGFNLAGYRGFLSGHRLAIEYGAPVYEEVNGVQLEADETVILGYQYAF